MPPIVDAVAQVKRVQIVPPRVFAIKTHASLALNATVHLVIHQRAKILIAKRSFAKAVNARAMTGHHCHVLKMAFAALVADRAIVWMVLHQALNHGRTKCRRFRVGNRDARVLRDWSHAGHYELACCVLLIAELLDRALTACSHRSQCRMPAEIRQVIAQRETGMQKVLLWIGLPRLVVDKNSCHAHCLHGHRCSSMCRRKSLAKYFNALCSGSTAPGAKAQNVFPGARNFVWNASVSRSRVLPLPCSIANRIFSVHARPLQHGVHQPHDSCAKKCSRFQTMPTGHVWSSSTTIVPVPRRLPAFCTLP